MDLKIVIILIVIIILFYWYYGKIENFETDIGSAKNSCKSDFVLSNDGKKLCANCLRGNNTYSYSCKTCESKRWSNNNGNLICQSINYGSATQSCSDFIVSEEGTKLCAKCKDAYGLSRPQTCKTCESKKWKNNNSVLECE